jgi:hypothetical protein
MAEGLLTRKEGLPNSLTGFGLMTFSSPLPARSHAINRDSWRNLLSWLTIAGGNLRELSRSV